MSDTVAPVMLVESKRALPNADGRTMKKIYVYVWFDIEDYVTEQSDGLPLTALSILNKYDVCATCKMVAEKVRVLIERNRSDVISAISRDDVGYHLDTHSRHPTVYEYLADLDVLEGAREFVEKERDGLELVEKTFGRRSSCFGHPGPAWASHYYPAMKALGIPVYLDETPILNLENRPYWYCGVLNLNGANLNFIKFDYTFESPTGITQLKAQFKEIHDRLHEEGDGGAVSFLFHLHTAINKEFWDAVNFADGKNRDRSEYVRPTPQPPEVTERGWRDFEQIVSYMTSFDDVRFITASDAIGIYRQPEISYDAEALESILDALGDTVKHLEVKEGCFVSASELFYLITRCLAGYAKDGRLPSRIQTREPLGPVSMADLVAPPQISTWKILSAAIKVLEQIDETGRLPSSVKLADDIELSTADFMVVAGKVPTIHTDWSTAPPRSKVGQGEVPSVEVHRSSSVSRGLPLGCPAQRVRGAEAARADNPSDLDPEAGGRRQFLTCRDRQTFLPGVQCACMRIEIGAQAGARLGAPACPSARRVVWGSSLGATGGRAAADRPTV